MKEDLFDVTIIGGGPAGLYSAFYSGLRELKTKIIEYQTFLGGKINLYPEKLIWDVGGTGPITGAKLIEQLVGQANTFHPEVVLNEKVVSIAKETDGIFVIRTASGKEHYSKTVIVAAGGGILNPAKLDIPGAETFETGNLHYSVQSLKRFKNKEILISGGGNSAVDWALELEPIARKVTLIYRGTHLKGLEAQITQLKNTSADIMLETEIVSLVPGETDDQIEKVELVSKKSGNTFSIEVDEVIVNHGFEHDASLLHNSELDLRIADNFYIAGSSMSESSVPGLYGAGDILKHDGKLFLIAGAFQDAANAVNSAKKYLEPEASPMAMVSSVNELLKEKNQVLIDEMLEGMNS